MSQISKMLPDFRSGKISKEEIWEHIKSIQDIRDIREFLLSAIKLNDAENLQELLVGQYSDPSHFIFEIMQNADDAGAKRISFILEDECLKIEHFGGNDFDLDDIKGVTGIGYSTKKKDYTKIGQFGAGFKSVYAVTSTPRIESGNYCFEIQDFMIPHEKKILPTTKKTTIIIPFDNPRKTKDEIIQLILTCLENLDYRSILFLNNLKKVEWFYGDAEGFLSSDIKTKDNTHDGIEACEVTINKSWPTTENNRFLLFKKPFDRFRYIQMAFKIETKDNLNKIVSIPSLETAVCVFFPTLHVSDLEFLVQAPFKTTINRERIPITDKDNQKLVNSLCWLLVDVFPRIKAMGMLDIDFLSIMPLDETYSGDSPVYDDFRLTLIRLLSGNEPFIPKEGGGFTTTEMTVIPSSEDFRDLLSKKDLIKFRPNHAWIERSIHRAEARRLLDFFNHSMSVNIFTVRNLIDELTEVFLQEKSDKWLTRLYTFFLQHPAYWRKDFEKNYNVRYKPIIRTKEKEMIAPFDDKDIRNVFLPSDRPSRFSTVKPSLLNNKSTREFLKELSLRKPNHYDELMKEVLPLYKKPDTLEMDDRYIEDIKSVIDFLGEARPKQLKNIVDGFSGAFFLHAYNPTTGITKFSRSDDVYRNTDILQYYFKGYESTLLISPDLKSSVENLEILLSALDVRSLPRLIKFNPNLSDERKKQLRGDCDYRGDVSEEDYKLDGLDNFLQQEINLKHSLQLWNILKSLVQVKRSFYAERMFQGFYSYSIPYHTPEEPFDAYFTNRFKNTEWLYDKRGELVKPGEISCDDLNEGYNTDFENFEIVIQVLGFRSTISQQLPEEEQEILRLGKEVGLDKLKAIVDSKKDDEQEASAWEPECDPDEAESQEIEYVSSLFPGEIIDLTSGQSGNNQHGGSPENEPSVLLSVDAKILYQIGYWAESYVYKLLKDEYGAKGSLIENDDGFKVETANGNTNIEVIWFNKNGESGIPLDLQIKDGNDEKYIEVKGTTSTDETVIPYTPREWIFAQEKYQNQSGHKYSIYHVTGVGSKINVRYQVIKDPVKEWLKGAIRIDVVAIQIA